MDPRFNKTNRDYIHSVSQIPSMVGMRISKKFLYSIEVTEDLKAKFESFKSKYGKYPQFSYNSRFRDTKSKSSINLQRTINGVNVENFFTKDDIETLIDSWIITYNSITEYENSRNNVEKVVENVCDFVKDNKLAVGCAVFGVAALAGVIPAIVNKYKSEADIREAVSYFMNSVDWDENDRDKTIVTTHTSFDSDGNVKMTSRPRTLSGNRNISKAIFTAVARYAKKNGITVRDAFHRLDGQKAKGLFGETGEDFYSFDIVKDNKGILTINVWNDAGRKPKTFEIDTNTYQRIGDVQYSWNESRSKRRNDLKESKVECDNANAYQFQQKLLEFFEDYLGDPITKAKAIKRGKPEPFTYIEHDEYGVYFYEVSLFGEYEDDVVIELNSAVIGGGCSYKLLTGDGSKCEHWMGMSLDEFEKDLDECFKVALGNRKVTESKKLKEFRPSKFRYDLDKSVSTKDKWNLKMDIESLKKELGDLQNTAANLPDEYVDDLCDSNNYPFDANIDDETSLGDWCQEVDDFLSSSLSLKENRKPYTPCEISAWEAKDYIQRQNLTCENEQGTLRIFYGPLEVGCMVFTPASYYLAGLDETVYWEGTTMNQFRVDFEEFKATLREADVEFTETGWIKPYNA